MIFFPMICFIFSLSIYSMKKVVILQKKFIWIFGENILSVFEYSELKKVVVRKFPYVRSQLWHLTVEPILTTFTRNIYFGSINVLWAWEIILKKCFWLQTNGSEDFFKIHVENWSCNPLLFRVLLILKSHKCILHRFLCIKHTSDTVVCKLLLDLVSKPLTIFWLN